MFECPLPECPQIVDGGRRVTEKFERGGQIADGALRVKWGGQILFAQFLSLKRGGNGQVTIMRCGVSELLLEKDLLGGGVEQVAAPDDMGDSLLLVIDHNGQLIGEESIGPADDEVSDLLPQLPLLRPLPLIFKMNGGVVGSQANGVLLNRECHVATCSWVDGGSFQLAARTLAAKNRVVRL